MPSVTWLDQGEKVEIYYEVVGQGEPVIMHHGNGNSLQNWYHLGYVDALASNMQLIMIDCRGYGKSSKFHDPKNFSLKSRATDTIKVLDALNIKKAHILGASFTAAFCFFLAKYYPERCQSYIFATPYFTLLNDPVLLDVMQQGASAYVAKLEEMFGVFDNADVRRVFLENDGKALWASNNAEWFEYQNYIQYIKSPSLIYVGSEESSVKELSVLAKQLPQCEFTILPGISHKEAYWNGKLVAPLILSFIEKHTI